MGKIKQLIEDSAFLFAKYHPDYSEEEAFQFVMENYPLDYWVDYPDFIERMGKDSFKIQVNCVFSLGSDCICRYLREHYLDSYLSGLILVELTESGFIVYIRKRYGNVVLQNIKEKCKEIENERDHSIIFPSNDWCIS